MYTNKIKFKEVCFVSNIKLSKKAIAGITAAAILLVFILSSCIYVFADSKIYSRVTCAGVKLSGMTEKQAAEALRKNFGDDPAAGKINLSLDGEKKSLFTDDIDVEYSYEKSAEEAYKFGREGGGFHRYTSVLGSLFKGHQIPLYFKYDEEKLDKAIDNLLEGIGTPVEEYSYKIEDGKLLVTNGKPGDMPNRDDIKAKILETIGKREFGEELKFKKEKRLPKEFNEEDLYKEVHKEAKDAEYAKEDGEVVIKDPVYGVDFDKKRAKSIIKDNKDYGKTFEIPADITEPELTKEKAEERLFTQTLGSYKTNYNSGDVSRSSNIALAASLVNNTVLLPGEEFSYNGTVGERTAANGFKMAHVYMNNEVADGLGGGICQVSSTLYCAVLYANIEVTERTCHQLPVTYVPLGQDATVDYGNIDFKFKNNTDYPIKIVTSAGGGLAEASILGYREVDEKVELYPVRTGTVAATVKEEPDDTLPLGEKKVEKQGSDGCTVELYKTVTKNGTTSERTLVSRSTYSGGKTIVKVGTKKPDENPEKTPEPSATPAQPTPTPALPPATPAPQQTLQPDLVEPQTPSTEGLMTPDQLAQAAASVE